MADFGDSWRGRPVALMSRSQLERAFRDMAALVAAMQRKFVPTRAVDRSPIDIAQAVVAADVAPAGVGQSGG